MARTARVPDETVTALTRWYDCRTLATRVLQGSLFGWLFGLSGQHAVTINGTVHMTRRAPDLASSSGAVLLGHELFHVEHQRRVGWWRFLAGYVWRWRPAHITRGWEHPYEAPAYARGGEIRASLEG